MTLPCDQTTEIPTILSAPIELTIDAKEPCESGNKSNLDYICLKIVVPMFNHFGMTSNLGDGSSRLGWFNDEHCQYFVIIKSFTYMCKLSCNIFMPLTSCDSILDLYFMTFEGCSCITVSHVPQLRSVKMHDIYIYNVYTLSLLLATFQIKQRRGRLCFQEGEDDEDMTTLDTTKNIAYMHICQVISSANYSIIYLCYPEQKYFTHFCVLSNCKCMGHLYNHI